jgi:hypothetical protein
MSSEMVKYKEIDSKKEDHKMTSVKIPMKSFWQAYRILLCLSLVKLFIHLISNGLLNYGYFRDEFYYLACSDHLAWGYVDQPPLSIFLLTISRWLFGDSLFALRLFPALAGAVTVFFTGLLARRMGGGKFSQALAALAMMTAPIFLALDTFFSMNAFDVLFWVMGFYLVLGIIQENKSSWWLWLGIITGLGMLNKSSMMWFIGGLVVGLLLTNHRKKISSTGPWLAALIAVVLFLPHLIWQIIHGFPTLEFMNNATSHKMAAVSFLSFVSSQVNILLPPVFLLCFIGLLYLFFHQDGSKYRWLGWLFLAIFLLLLLSRTSRPNYLAPAYPILAAGGAVFLESFTSTLRKWFWLRPLYIILMIAVGIITAPIGLPLLPVDSYIRYAKFLGVTPSTAERKALGKLGQFYADMHGWEKLVDKVAGVYNLLTPSEKQKCKIFANNYGEAGAIDFFGSRFHLPSATCGHNNYWLWGPGKTDFEVVIHLGGQNGPSEELLQNYYREFIHADTFTCNYCMPYENNTEIYICRGPKYAIKEIWPRLKHFD